MSIIKFPIINNHSIKMPKQRVFYICYKLTGPSLCQEVYHFYLKRKGLKNGNRKWSIITYEKYDEYSSREYAIELDTCEEDDVPKMLDQYYVGHHIKIEDLQEMGWQGKVYNKSNVIDFDVNNSS